MIFNTNTHFASGSIDVPVAEGYTHNTGVIQAMIENTKNADAIFTSLVGNDFAELHEAHNPGALTESQIEAVHEASTGGFIDKVIAFLKKAWEKIKGFFKSFWDTIRAMLTKDNKELVNKFKAQVMKKDLSKMKYKYRNATGKVLDIGNAADYDVIAKASATNINALYANSSAEELQKMRSEINETDTKESILGAIIGQSSVSVADFNKEAMDYIFEDQDEYEGLDATDLSGLIGYLSESSKYLKDVKKNEDEVNKVFKSELSALEKSRNTLIKKIPSADSQTYEDNKHNGESMGGTKTNDDRQRLSSAISVVYDGLNVAQTVFNIASAAQFAAVKFGIKQARTVFIAAVRHNPKAVKESNMMFEHYADESNYEFDLMVEGAGY